MNYEDFKKQKQNKVRFDAVGELNEYLATTPVEQQIKDWEDIKKDIPDNCGMTENEKNLALSLAKIKIDKLIDLYYTKRNPQLEHFDKENLLGKIAFDLLELRGILDGCKYNPFDEQAKVMNEADKRKDILQNEKELNPDVFTKDISADNLEKINQRAEYNANDYIGHPFNEDEDTSISYARKSYEAGFKQGWQEGETYGFDKGFDFCEQINANNQTMWIREPDTDKFIPISYPADAPLGQDMKGNFIYPINQALENAAREYKEHTPFQYPNQLQPAYEAFIAGAKWQKEYWDKVMRDNHIELL